MKKPQLSLEHIKVIILISMLCDNIAWAFCNVNSIASDILHMFGKMAGPLIIFALIEAFRLTKNKTALWQQMGALLAIMIIPVVIFFHHTVSWDTIRESFASMTTMDWVFRLIGLLFAYPVYRLYNGQLGEYIGGKSAVFWCYPVHFLALAAIKELYTGSPYEIYLYLHVATVVLCFLLLFVALFHRTSQGQVAIIFFFFSAMIYIAGFVLEILSNTTEGFYLACLVQYFGEALVFVAMFFYIQTLCKINIPYVVYAFQIVISLIIVYGVMSTRRNHFFYRDISVDTSGYFNHLKLEYGPGFFITMGYIAVLSVVMLILIIRFTIKADGAERKRGISSIIALGFSWLPYLLKIMGLTGGYEIPGLGMGAAGLCFMLTITKYGFLDSYVLASELVVENGAYGILIMDTRYMLTYENAQMEAVFGKIDLGTDLRTIPIFNKFINHELTEFYTSDKVYDIRIDPLMEKNLIQGYMIAIFDNTQHYLAVQQIRENAERDPLTKLYNRSAFQEKMEKHLKEGRGGTFIMMDLDNFKQVNDKYGHKMGDAILLLLANVFKQYSDEQLLTCRIGGDEFAGFVPDNTDEAGIKDLITNIMMGFSRMLSGNGYDNYTSISVGALICDKDKASIADFDKFYTGADALMYDVKRAGKNKFVVKNM